MFNAIEAVDDIIDEINIEFADAKYEAVLDELVYRVESGELTLDEAQLVSESAYEKYMLEAVDIGDANKKYLEQMKKACNTYKSNFKKIKSEFKKDPKKAINDLNKLKSDLNDIKSNIDKIPVDSKSEMVSLYATAIKGVLVACSFTALMAAVNSYRKGNDAIIAADIDEDLLAIGKKAFKDSWKDESKNVKKSLNPINMTDSFKTGVTMAGANHYITTQIKGEDANRFKRSAKKAIDNEIKNIEKLQKKCEKLIK